MSSYLVNPEHIGALAAFAVQHDAVSRPLHGSCGFDSARYVARLLAEENVRSVHCRYPARKDEQHEAFYLSAEDWAEHYYFNPPNVSPLGIISMCRCLDYQSCDTSDWDDTPACKQLTIIQDAAITALPGYKEASKTYRDYSEGNKSAPKAGTRQLIQAGM